MVGESWGCNVGAFGTIRAVSRASKRQSVSAIFSLVNFMSAIIVDDPAVSRHQLVTARKHSHSNNDLDIQMNIKQLLTTQLYSLRFLFVNDTWP